MSLLKPRRIAPGATIGIVSPSSPIDPEKLEKGLQPFYQRGYRIAMADHALDKRAYLAGTDKDRAADLMKMFADPKIDAIVCSRGGYGAARLVPYLDARLVRDSRKLLAGYSDITVLLLWMLKQAGLMGFYAPMPLTMSRHIPDHAYQVMWRAFEGDQPLGYLPTWDPPFKTLQPGVAEGRITGGCLCLVAASVGTSYEIDSKDSIVVIEDVDEPPYRLDAFVNQLKLAGKWDDCNGVAISEDTNWESKVSEGDDTLTPDEVWQDYFADLGKPVITGFPFGHIADPLTLPFGALARLDAATGKLEVLEEATSA